MNRRTLAAAAALAAIAAAAAAGSSGSSGTRSPATAVNVDRTVAKPTTTVRPRRDEASVLASRYAALARTWNAASYRRTWRRELALTTGAYHGQLRSLRPTKRSIASLRADHASSRATVIRARRVGTRSTDRVSVDVELDERTRAGAQLLSSRTRNRVALEQRHGEWLVSGFTVLAGGEHR